MQTLQELLKVWITYDPDSGIVRWRRDSRYTKAGERADKTFFNKQNNYWYSRIALCGQHYATATIIWVYVTGRFPKTLVDHKDLDATNNRWTNLREATQSQNVANQRLSNRNTSGFKNVYWSKRKRKWHVLCKLNNKTKSLGHFDCLFAAVRTARLKAREIYGEFARHA